MSSTLPEYSIPAGRASAELLRNSIGAHRNRRKGPRKGGEGREKDFTSALAIKKVISTASRKSKSRWAPANRDTQQKENGMSRS